ncbi:SURF1 family protein [Sinorhizobium sp. CCBAU 05631]|uniref:SURF1 family protein n=1 Tax=Sinorhizobium sp. CCBAU 05631 TaxID=794846 RepID=UPI0004B3F5D6|nr:SURF1 family protein [Sinorhizobium sp. CCBAU 05631]ASY59590.1 Cytochrome oxidase biogenesis protein Surf1, facilitates heme A insertion [Sinorhizobium sp. CCBAU 05631]
MINPKDDTAPSRRSRTSLIAVSSLGLLLIAGLLALGTWQVGRLSWKSDLIARVEQRIHAAPVPPPSRSDWPNVSRARDEYRRVRVRGQFLYDKETLVYAATELGAGYWAMTPLALDDGTTVLVNRGFVPTDKREASSRMQSQVEVDAEVTGLMRMDEPKGSLLRSNRPEEERWYSRDVGAIAAARRLSGVAPYFIDADVSPNPGGLPVGGLTRVAFPNNHLVYAITWFCLALMSAAMLILFWRSAARASRDAS